MQGDVVTGDIFSNDGCRTQEITSVIPIARVAECPHPLMGMGLQNRGPRTNHLSPFVPCVSRRTDGCHPAIGWWEVWRCRARLAVELPAACHLRQRHTTFSTSIPEPSCGLSLLCEWPSNQILLKKSTQGLDSRLIKSCKKATECGARRQFGSAEQSHKWRGKGASNAHRTLSMSLLH